MEKNFMKIALAIAVVATGSYKAYSMYIAKNVEDSLLMENVEALSQWSEGNFTSDGYACVHTHCYSSYGLPTGKCYATAWKGGSYKTYHSHLAKECCSYK